MAKHPYDISKLNSRLRRIADEYGIGEFSEAKQNLPIRKRFLHKEIADIVEKCHGLTHDICLLLDCSTQEWNAYLQKCPDIKALQQQVRETLVDKAESKLCDNLDSQNEQISQKAAEFTLKTLGRKRGYDSAPQQEVTVKDGTVSIKQIFGID